MTKPTDEGVLADIVAGGRAKAAVSISRILSGTYSVSDPLDSNPTTYLMSAFQEFGPDAREIFREALGDILARERPTPLGADELSVALYLGWKTDLFDRDSHRSKRTLLRTLDGAASGGDAACVDITLKYLSSSKLITRVDEWREIHRKYGRNHLLACFMGMAHASLSQAILWLAEQPEMISDEAKLIADYAIPALTNAVGGVDRVRGSLQRLRPELDSNFFDLLSRGFGRAVGIPEDELTQFVRYMGDGRAGHLNEIGEVEFSDSEAQLASMGSDWDEAALLERPPAEIIDIYSRSAA